MVNATNQIRVREGGEMSQRAEPAGADPWPGNVSRADRATPPSDVDDSWMPDALDDWALDVPDEAWEDWLGTESPQPPEALPAGLLPRDRGDGAGFAAGGVADRLVPDMALAGFARDAWANGLDRLSDDELIGLLRAWRRLNSWAAPVITGSVNLTMPLTTWLGAAEAPGEAAGFGPIPADDARALADLIASQPGTRWCLTLTDRDGRAIGHGCARAGPNRRRPGRARADRNSDGGDRAGPDSAGRDEGWALTVTVRSLAVGDCSHERETAGYRPSPSLQHVISVRGRTCSFPGCRRPAVQCDQDHTIPYDQGGRTCECNLMGM